MSTFYVDPENSSAVCEELRTLRIAWDNEKPEFPTSTDASGPVYDLLLELAEQYQTIHEVFGEIIGNTAELMQGTSDSFKETDENLAQSIAGESND